MSTSFRQIILKIPAMFRNIAASVFLLAAGAGISWFFNNLKCDKSVIKIRPEKLCIIDDSTTSKCIFNYSLYAIVNRNVHIEFKEVTVNLPQVDKRLYKVQLDKNITIQRDTLIKDSVIFHLPHFGFVNTIPSLSQLGLEYLMNNRKKVVNWRNVSQTQGLVSDNESTRLPPGVIVKNNDTLVIRTEYMIPYKGRRYKCYLWPPHVKISAVRYKDDLIYIDLEVPPDSSALAVGNCNLQTTFFEPRLDVPDAIKGKIRLSKFSDVTVTYEMHGRNEITYNKYTLPYGKRCYIYIFGDDK